MCRTRLLPAVLALALLVLATPALHARPAHKRALADHFGSFLPKKLNDCRTCHLPDRPGQKESEDDKPHNPFGARLKAVKTELKRAGKETSLAARLEAVADEDSDGDSVPNLIELLAGTHPGEAADKPDSGRLTAARKTLLAFRESLKEYRWRPFETVQRPPEPEVKNRAWVRNPIDAFISAEHERLGLKPRPEAPPSVLLRRLYLDLIGLPPTREDLHAFLQDRSDNAYEKVVDRLLASPQYGERWGRHWMDVWRYSDWAGYGQQVRDSQPHIWRWRDWIIESLNADKGYDRMILEMLAGDELAPDDPGVLRATGYLVRNWKLLSRETWMQETVEHTFMAFQGVTLGCAKCHDHMFDPILQTDYYQVRAIFEPHNIRTDRLPGQPDTKKDGVVRVYDEKLDVPTFLFIRGDDRTPDKNRKMLPGVPEALGGAFAVLPVKLPPTGYSPGKRAFVVVETVAAAQAAVAKARAALPAVRDRAAALIGHIAGHEPLFPGTSWLATYRASLGLALAANEVGVAQSEHEALLAVLRVERLEDGGDRSSAAWQAAARTATQAQRQAALKQAHKRLLTVRLARANFRPLPGGSKNPLNEKQAAKAGASDAQLAEAQKTLAKAEAELQLPPTAAYKPRAAKAYPATSTGRRLAFARWLTSKDNPLTARVAMNHVWLRHFGQAVVPSVFDFGRNGRPPSHPALLDWLAAEFMERGWSMKAMHRLIVTSSTYRMASTPDAKSAAIDRDNKYLWRMAPRRAEAEVVRDSIFHVAGKLDLTLGGPELNFTEGLTAPRRSLYFRHAAEKQMEFLQLFDAASVSECYERKHSIVPQQALALNNSEVARKHGRLLAQSLAAKVGADPSAFVTAAFEHVLTRAPTPSELAECTDFLQERTRHYQQQKIPPQGGKGEDGRLPSPDPALRARESLIHVLLNHHEFVTMR